MEEEEARLKSLLEQTEDFDERRKIRAELRAVRKKMLDSLSATAEAESHERAARRAERARARKAEEESNHIGPSITDKILSEIDDEATLQKLLDEIPTSQIEDRRRLRARIREVKRKKTEDSEPAPRRTRRPRETTETSEEPSTRDKRYRKTASEESIERKSDGPSSVTMETSSDDGSSVTIETTPDGLSVAIETTHDGSSVTIETTSEEPPAVTIGTKTEEPSMEVTNDANHENISAVSIETNTDTVTIETTSATTTCVDDNEIKFKLTLRQSKDIHIEEDTETTAEQSSSVDIDGAVEVPNEEPSGTSVEINIEQSLGKDHVEVEEARDLAGKEDSQNAEEIESAETVLEDKKDEETPAKEEIMETGDETLQTENNNISAEDGNASNGISVELKMDEEVNLNIDTEKENQHPNEDSKELTNEADTPDAGKISKENKDSSAESKAPKVSPGSRRPPQDDDKKKHGKVNQVDFRTNLKKSGKIGQGVVNLEKKNPTTGAQVDFRSGNLKKSGRIGHGTVNLENKISTHGAQVDFRSSSLKPSGKIGVGVVHLERKTTTTGAQVDFRSALKKGEGSARVKTPASNERKGSLKSETVGKEAEESEKIEQPEETKKPEIEEKGEAEDKLPSEKEVKDDPPTPKEVTIPAVVEKKVPFKKEPRLAPAKKEKSSETQNDSATKKEDIPTPEKKEDKNEESPAQVDIKLDVKTDNLVDTPATTVNDTTKENTTVPIKKEKQLPEQKTKVETKYKPRDSYKTREDTKVAAGGGKNKLFEKWSKFQAKDETAVRPKVTTPVSRTQKKEPTPDKAVNGLAAKVENTSLAVKEPESSVQIEVTEHVEDDGDTHTEVREEKTTKQDGDEVEEKKEVTTTTKTTTPGGGKFTTQTKETTKTTTKKTFMDPEMQKRMAARQRERAAAKREQASSAKNKRMAFMQKLEANSPAQKGASNIKRSGSNVDKLLAWCRFKLRDYEGVKLTNFSSSWADGLAFCALLHLYLPDKIPYEELLAGGDKRRNFEVAFGAATDAGVAELLEVDDMLSVANPEPKSVMTYVSSIYKHFNPS